ncbi:hypothetical protein OIU84_028234 [Salix udensis]|uniref:DNA2/NAM7 helicase helicase domain-containing protein n=1 Tax=Salix udensis TaxID=889485 RepID=A0AAD6P9X7_9ROSI|nr:hypothetical protein OIU84_028234 [Salix udensis]
MILLSYFVIFVEEQQLASVRSSKRAGLHETKRGSELPIQEKYKHWALASPWLSGNNPRDKNMPKDGNDGFFPTSGNDFKPEVVDSSRKYRVRVLVCAPSNSALDEIVLRLLKTVFQLVLLKIDSVDHCPSGSIFNMKKEKSKPLIVPSPVKRNATIFMDCMYLMDGLLNLLLALCMYTLEIDIDRTGVHDENVRTYNPKVVRIGLKAHHSVQSVCMDNLVKQKQGESASDKQKHRTAGRDTDSIRADILEESVIVFSTLSFSGSALFSKLNHGFDVVIIDEAAQAVEPATLVPLVNGCKQVFLVGDPVQLPATVISPTAGKFGYGTSLFERFQRAGYPVNMLKMQYRMHPELFPISKTC